jgi:hypothetical protein
VQQGARAGGDEVDGNHMQQAIVSRSKKRLAPTFITLPDLISKGCTKTWTFHEKPNRSGEASEYFSALDLSPLASWSESGSEIQNEVDRFDGHRREMFHPHIPPQRTVEAELKHDALTISVSRSGSPFDVVMMVLR